jgi:hypothetical protein
MTRHQPPESIEIPLDDEYCPSDSDNSPIFGNWCCLYGQSSSLLKNYDLRLDESELDEYEDESNIALESLTTERLSLSSTLDSNRNNHLSSILQSDDENGSDQSDDEDRSDQSDDEDRSDQSDDRSDQLDDDSDVKQGTRKKRESVSFDLPLITSVKSRVKTEMNKIDDLYYSEADIEGFAKECRDERHLIKILQKTLPASRTTSLASQGESPSPDLRNKWTLETATMSEPPSFEDMEILEGPTISECPSLDGQGSFETAVNEHDMLEEMQVGKKDSSLMFEIRIIQPDIYFDANEE